MLKSNRKPAQRCPDKFLWSTIVVNTPRSNGKTLFEKIFDRHVIVARESGDALLFIDRQLINDLHYRSFD